MLGGQPTPLDPFEARQLLLTLLFVSMFSDAQVDRFDAGVHDRKPTGGRSAAGKRRHVRPARSC